MQELSLRKFNYSNFFYCHKICADLIYVTKIIRKTEKVYAKWLRSKDRTDKMKEPTNHRMNENEYLRNTLYWKAPYRCYGRICWQIRRIYAKHRPKWAHTHTNQTTHITFKHKQCLNALYHHRHIAICLFACMYVYSERAREREELFVASKMKMAFMQSNNNPILVGTRNEY